MNDRHAIFDWYQRGAVTDVRAALQVAGVLPAAHDWRLFLDRLLLWSGAVALSAAVVFFVAHNWNELGKLFKFVLVGLLVTAAALGYWRLGPERAAGKASLLVAAILLGALLALFGQTYQTGADTWELFATWAALMAPWVLLGRFAGLWMFWIAIVNVGIVLYFQVLPSMFGITFSTERQLWMLFTFNTAALAAWELAAQRLTWMDERWAPRLLAVASGGTVTLLMLHAIFEWRAGSGAAALIAYLAWLACAYGAYRVLARDLLVLAGGCLSIIVVVTAFLGKNILDRGGADAYLLITFAVIGMAAASGWWLRQVAIEADR